MLTLLLLTACGSSEHQIIDSSSPSLAGDEEACEPTVVEQPIINLSCPEPVINLSCPEPVVQVEVAAPDVQVSVAAPEVDVNVAGPDMTGIEAAIDDMADLITTNNTSSSTTNAWWYSGSLTSFGTPVLIFQNNTSGNMIINQWRSPGFSLECWVEDLNGGFADLYTHAGSVKLDTGIPIAAGESVYCQYAHDGNGSSWYLFNGYYQ